MDVPVLAVIFRQKFKIASPRRVTNCDSRRLQYVILYGHIGKQQINEIKCFYAD